MLNAHKTHSRHLAHPIAMHVGISRGMVCLKMRAEIVSGIHFEQRRIREKLSVHGCCQQSCNERKYTDRIVKLEIMLNADSHTATCAPKNRWKLVTEKRHERQAYVFQIFIWAICLNYIHMVAI